MKTNNWISPSKPEALRGATGTYLSASRQAKITSEAWRVLKLESGVCSESKFWSQSENVSHQPAKPVVSLCINPMKCLILSYEDTSVASCATAFCSCATCFYVVNLWRISNGDGHRLPILSFGSIRGGTKLRHCSWAWGRGSIQSFFNWIQRYRFWNSNCMPLYDILYRNCISVAQRKLHFESYE